MIKTKANNGTGNVPKRDMWETPQWLYDILNEQYDFKFDCCANSENSKAPKFSDRFLGLFGINDMSWMNPPFSKAISMFIHFFENVSKGVAIYRCDNFETVLWQREIFPNASWIFIPNKRIVYEGLEGMGARFPSALIGLNVEPPKNLKGTLLRPESMSDTGSIDD